MLTLDKTKFEPTSRLIQTFLVHSDLLDEVTKVIMCIFFTSAGP